MIKQAFILIAFQFILSALVPSTWAQDMRAMNSKKDELELEKEIEDMEKYGEAAGQVEADREMTRLTQETRKLEREIESSRRSNENAIKKTKRLVGLYQKKARLAAAVQLQADRAEIRKNRSEKIMMNLDAKIKMKEASAIQAVQRRKAAESDYRQLVRDLKVLERRLRVADATIKRNDQKRKTLRAKSLTISRAYNKLKKKVASAESRATRL